ncbi:hypothetical protein CBF34_08185 [Vagococcus penaei]|uniref:Uncharacterized protein n=2 Tax=Vagococcus penaei TaxID=633807 RepID=A0A1Q2D4Z2_9ENTE|nr:helix-turn-helix domain-containing protein [Vagococcus penaei]AQP53470.1 hypothetical protein BW732_03920 [Vagococcus penaei]RSU00860.1 hypothetical protein CBF34_08185 [Vagococcus penaei]
MEKNIFNLLNNHNKVILNMLEIISENNRWYSVNEISLQLNVVERTVQRYIHQLEDIVAEYNTEKRQQITLMYEKYKGIYLEIEQGSNYIDFRNYILENDESMLILKKIMFEEFDSVKKYAMTYYVSESMVRKSLKKIKDFLNLYNIDLSRNSFKLIGDEKQIRLVSYIIAWVTFKGVTWPFNTIDQRKIYQTVDGFSNAMKLNVSDIHRKQMAYIFAVNLLRLRKNHIMPFEKSWDNYVNLSMLKESIPLLKSFMADYSVHIDAEIYFYVLLMQTKVKIYESNELRDRILGYHKKMNSDIYRATELFVKQFESELTEIPYEIKERFFVTSFCAHLFAQLFTQINMDIDGHPLFELDDNEFPTLRGILSKFIDDLYEQSQNPLFLEKGFLIQKYLLLFSSILPLTHYEPAIYIYLETDLPYFIKQNIMVRISDRFKHDFNLSFLDMSQKDKADIIFTNVPNLIEERQRFTYGILLFDFPIKLRDFIELEKKLQIVVQKKVTNQLI